MIENRSFSIDKLIHVKEADPRQKIEKKAIGINVFIHLMIFSVHSNLEKRLRNINFRHNFKGIFVFGLFSILINCYIVTEYY
ncbi:MAG: hypothetical protein BAJALOKI2v1_430012 [Promethearchaeota archaeon]|nr:MAG: hypothetical protein BAJALOKI2v1_430012 [Candidatus Lokiarchaeota archaeon]